MKITRRQLRRIIREGLLHEQPEQMSLPMHGAEPLHGDADDDYYAATRTPEAVEALKAAGFSSNGEIFDDSMGLGVFSHGMYTPKNQQELEDQIQAAIEINAALMAAADALEAGKAQDGQEAYWDIVLPVQQKWRDRGASDTEGRETSGGWLEDQGYDWGY